MSIEEKEAKIIDLNLFSGSADAFRTAVGGYFEVVDVETTEDTTITTGQETQFNDYSTLDVKSPFIYTMAKDQWSPTGQAQPISDNIIIPNMRYAVRAYASLENWKNDIFGRLIGLEEVMGAKLIRAFITKQCGLIIGLNLLFLILKWKLIFGRQRKCFEYCDYLIRV